MRKEKRPSTDQGFLLSVAEVAMQLGVCRQTVYNLIYHEGLPTIRVGKLRRIDPESLHAWLKEREHRIA
jgi:excisionase family DNA binding protein